MVGYMVSREWEPTYSEFSDSRLVSIYNTVNPIDSYKSYYVELASELEISSIIDVGCGTGLLTSELSAAGHEMIGVEPSRPMLDLARAGANAEVIRWISGGVEQLESLQAEMVIMTGHVAQFFIDDLDWEAALSFIRASLGSRGYFAFESRNPGVEIFSGWPTSDSHRVFQDPIFGEIEWWYEMLEIGDGRVRYENHYLLSETCDELVSLNELRFRTLSELRHSLARAGFSLRSTFGDWNRSPFDDSSPEMIIVVETLEKS